MCKQGLEYGWMDKHMQALMLSFASLEYFSTHGYHSR